MRPQKYAQCDFLLTKREWLNTIEDVESRIDQARESDNFPIFAQSVLNEKIKDEKVKKSTGPKYFKPD